MFPRFRKSICLTAFLVLAWVLFILVSRPTPGSGEISQGGGRSLAESSHPAAVSQADDSDGIALPVGSSDSSAFSRQIASGRSAESTMTGALVPVGGLMPVTAESGQARSQSTRELATPGKSVVSILEGVDMSDPPARARAEKEMRELETAQRAAVEKKAHLLGVPLRIDGPGHKVSKLHDFHGDEPVYRTTQNANAAISTGVNLLVPAPYSLTGAGIKVGVWDAGSIRNTHQELIGRVAKQDSSSAEHDHSTHVAGTIGASGVQAGAKGMAPQIHIDSYDWYDDYAEMTAAGSATAGDAARLALSNHSYGYKAVTADMGRYETQAASIDAVAASLPYFLPCWAAGNNQDTLTSLGGYQSITFNGLGKNVLTVGAVDDAVSGGVRAPANGTIAYFSSLGPCDDGRIKPDVVANGVGVNSCISGSDTAYNGSYSGTSMATPNVSGSASLLVELHAREFSGQRMRASMLKGLLIHTADDLGNPGPDYTYGWGLVNVKAAADVILAHKQSLAAPKMIEGTITSANKIVTRTFTWDGASPIRATLCWTDPAGAAQSALDSRTANLKHNLDVKLTAPDGTTVIEPFVMPFVGIWSESSMATAATRGKNNVDNVEQVYLPSPTQAGTYTVTVSLDASLTTSSQAYSLILTGGTNEEANPPPGVALTSPVGNSEFLTGSTVTISATASDVEIGGVPGSVTQVEFFSGAALLGVDQTAPYSLEWTPPAPGNYTLTAKATDNEGASATSVDTIIKVNPLFGEDFASITSGSHTNWWSASTSWEGNINFPTVSNTYQAGGAVRLGSSSAAGSITSRSMDLGGNGGNFTVTFKVKGWITVEGDIKVTPSGLSPQTVNYTSVMSGSFETVTLRFAGGQANSTIKLETTARRAFLDEIMVFYTDSGNIPRVTASGTLANLDAIYGSPSGIPASFIVSGANLAGGILVTPPAGFEVSQTSGGGSGYAATQLVGAAGTTTETRVYVRLAAGISAGSYSGDLSITSAGAFPVAVSTVAGEVRPKPITLAAGNRTKAFGEILMLGSEQTSFTTAGLVGAESIGSVTLIANGGTAANDPPGIYQITPSAATGGTFNPANYEIDFVAGILTVDPRSFADWLLTWPTLTQIGETDDPDADGQNNLMEYFAGTHPGVVNPPAVTVGFSGDDLILTYHRAKGITGVNVLIRWSSDLTGASWNTSDVTGSTVDMGDYEQVTATLALPQATPGHLVRLELVRP